MAPTTLHPAERPRVTPPWPRSPSCRTRNPHNVVGDVGILRGGLPLNLYLCMMLMMLCNLCCAGAGAPHC